jgi:hypothetical protein
LKLKAASSSRSWSMLHGAHLWTAVLWLSWQNVCCAYSPKKRQ